MPGLTKMVVPRGLGLVAALAVSGTALYLVYELNKKKTFGRIRKGKGALRLEYHVRPHGPPEQQETNVPKDFEGGSDGLRDGNEVEVHCQHLPCLRRATRRQSEQPLQLLESASGQSHSRIISQEEEESLADGRVECKADETQFQPSNAENSLLSCAADNHLQEGCGEPVQNSPVAVGLIKTNDKATLDALYKLDRGSSDSLSSIDDSEEFTARPAVENLVLQSSSSSSDEECSSNSVSLAAVSSLPAPSNAAAPSPPPRSFAIVGCFVHTGNGSAAVTRKKVVRFSPSVIEPSSNNQDYRRRFKTQMAQKAARSAHQRSKSPASTAVRSIAYDRPRLYSQAAKQAVTYSVHRNDYCYGGRSY